MPKNKRCISFYEEDIAKFVKDCKFNAICRFPSEEPLGFRKTVIAIQDWKDFLNSKNVSAIPATKVEKMYDLTGFYQRKAERFEELYKQTWEKAGGYCKEIEKLEERNKELEKDIVAAKKWAKSLEKQLQMIKEVHGIPKDAMMREAALRKQQKRGFGR